VAVDDGALGQDVDGQGVGHGDDLGGHLDRNVNHTLQKNICHSKKFLVSSNFKFFSNTEDDETLNNRRCIVKSWFGISVFYFQLLECIIHDCT